jgi:hypothetical protein
MQMVTVCYVVSAHRVSPAFEVTLRRSVVNDAKLNMDTSIVESRPAMLRFLEVVQTVVI